MVKSRPSARLSEGLLEPCSTLPWLWAQMQWGCVGSAWPLAQPWLVLAHVQGVLLGCACILRAVEIHTSDSLPRPHLTSEVCPAPQIGREVRSLK